jgi:nucleotide-binding universal stress UspA family protein
LGAAFEATTIVEVLLLPPEYAPPGVEPGAFELEFIREAREKAEAQLHDADAAGAPLHVRAGFAAELVNKVAGETGADLIVVGAHPEPALAHTLVGSTGRRILYLADRPVLLASEPRRDPFRRIIAAIDLSAQSGRVLDAAGAVARADRAELRVLYVLEPLPVLLVKSAIYDEAEHRRHSREQLEAMLDATGLAREEWVAGRMREGRAGTEILEEAQDWDADLIVMGSHGFGFFDRLLLGSTPLYVLRHGHRATLIVPSADKGG